MRYTSDTKLFGLPLISIATGPDFDKRQARGVACGIIAIGDVAAGVVAVGGASFGVIAIGGLAIGLAAVGGAAIGGLAGIGGLATGVWAIGGAAFGIHTISGDERLRLSQAEVFDNFAELNRIRGWRKCD
jgi:hypothetical protein